MMKRIQDTRFSYDLNGGELSEPVASNYYPINSGNYHAYIDQSPFKILILGLAFKAKIMNRANKNWAQFY